MSKRVASGWTCPACTLENDSQAVACEACGNSSPDSWQCAVCTVSNVAALTQCQACDTSRTQGNFLNAFVVPAQKKAALEEAPLAVKVRLGDGSVVALEGLRENSPASELYEVARKTCKLPSDDFVLLVRPNKKVSRDASEPLGALGVHNSVLTVSGAGGSWKACKEGGFVHSQHQPLLPETELCVGQLNVWFDEAFFVQRARAQIRTFESLKCDVVCLQEVTQPYLDCLLRDPWVQRTFWLSHMLIESYGVALLSRVPAARLTEHALPSIMGRTLLVAEFPAPLPAVATVHLESMSDSMPVRIQQLDKAMAILGPLPEVLVCGDFNFDSGKPVPEGTHVTKDFLDVMPMKPTMGINYPSRKYPPARFDRVLHKSAGLWKPAPSLLFGDKKLATDPAAPVPASDYLRSRGAFLSDHLGLVARFLRK
jgi:endonuclease/exonuclease/phosphatase family metal-dependent hydrolase